MIHENDGKNHKFKNKSAKYLFLHVKEGAFIQCLKHILKNEDLVNEKDNVTLSLYKSLLQFDYTALHWAAKRGHVKICELLLTFGANHEAKDIVRIYLINAGQFGRKALDHAESLRHIEVIELLRAARDKTYNGDKDQFREMFTMAMLNSFKDPI